MSAWKNDFIKINQYSRPADKLHEVRKIIAHYTANPGASASNHKKYFGETLVSLNEKLPKEDRRYASAHLFIDKIEAICIVPLDEITFAANDNQKYVNGKPYRGVPELLPNANFLSINVELCIEEDGTFHPDTLKRAEDVFAELCKMFKLDPIKDIVMHYNVTAKNCPALWVSKPNEFIDFKNHVKAKMEQPPITKEGNRVLNLNGSQFKMLADSYELANELGILSDEKWHKLAAERKMTVDEATYLNAVIMKHLLKKLK